VIFHLVSSWGDASILRIRGRSFHIVYDTERAKEEITVKTILSPFPGKRMHDLRDQGFQPWLSSSTPLGLKKINACFADNQDVERMPNGLKAGGCHCGSIVHIPLYK
jgi:hypothetical protein